MKIVVLDGYTLNPGDLSWEGLDKLGELTVFDRTIKETAAEPVDIRVGYPACGRDNSKDAGFSSIAHQRIL